MKKYITLMVAVFLLIGCEKKEEKKEVAVVSESPSINIVENAIDISKDYSLITHDIEGKERISLAPAGEEETTLTREVAAYHSIKNTYENINKELLSKKLSKNYFLKCSACHDDYANGVIGPSLLTKTSDDIFNMIKAYKVDKDEHNVLMRYLVSQMDDKEIRSLADEIAEFNKEVRELQQ